MVISAAVQSAEFVLLQLPLPTLVALVAVTTVVVAVAVRVLSNTFHGNKPPVDEGIPFIGGLLKFSKVSGEVQQAVDLRDTWTVFGSCHVDCVCRDHGSL